MVNSPYFIRYFVPQIASIALLCLAAVGAQAQSRTCVIDETNGVLRCGQLADQFGRRILDSNTNRNSDRNFDRNDGRSDNRNEGRSPPVFTPRPTINSNDGYDPRMSYEERQAFEQRRMQAQEVVNSLFLDVLGRDADIVTLRKVTSQVMEGRAMADVRIELATSAEARTAVAQIYRDVLRREADPSGLNAQMAALRGGLTLAQIRQAIAESPEGRNRR